MTRLDYLIRAILHLSCLGRCERLDVLALVQETMQTLAHQIAERQAQVTVNPLPTVMADRTAISQEERRMPSKQSVTSLLVEDDPGHARLIERNLRRALIPKTIVMLGDGQQAIDGSVANFQWSRFRGGSPAVTQGAQRGRATRARSVKGAQFPQEIMLRGGRWYVAYPLRYRHVEALLEERGGRLDHATIQRWVVPSSPQLAEAFHRRKRAVWISWRMEESDSKGQGARHLDRPRHDPVSQHHGGTRPSRRKAEHPSPAGVQGLPRGAVHVHRR